MARNLDPKSLVFHDVISRGDITPDKLLYLIDRLYDINTTDKKGSTLLDAAIFWDRKDLCKVLLENGADVESLNNTCESPLRAAASGGHFELCKLLIEHGANLNPRSRGLTQPVQSIFQYRRIGDDLSKIHSDICRLFIDKGVDIRIMTRSIYEPRPDESYESMAGFMTTHSRWITEPARTIIEQRLRDVYGR